MSDGCQTAGGEGGHEQEYIDRASGVLRENLNPFVILGEPGTELMVIPKDAQVYPNHPTQKNVNITFTCNLTEDQLREMVRQMVRETLAEYDV